MAIQIPSALIEFILLGPSDDRRQLQDSPILGDVWVKFGKEPAEPIDLLIVPYQTEHAGTVASAIFDTIYPDPEAAKDDRTSIACLQGLVAARLSFEEVLRVVLPKTKWWLDKWVKETLPTHQSRVKGKRIHRVREAHQLSAYNADSLSELLPRVFKAAQAWQSESGQVSMHDVSPLDRFVTLAGLILWAGDTNGQQSMTQSPNDSIKYVLNRLDPERISSRFQSIIPVMLAEKKKGPLIWQVSLNRAAVPALTQSVPAVKADAARTLFKVDCSKIAWAVLDCGIEADHPAFQKLDGSGSRIKRTFDFSNFRRIVSLANLIPTVRKSNVEALMLNKSLLHRPTKPDTDLQDLAESVRDKGPIHWELIEKFVEIDPRTPPQAHHGTHVAGIIGASKAAAERNADAPNADIADGMCPDISLYDFRVLGAEIKEPEFNIIAALQYIRQLNDRDNFYSIHGANLSLSIPHDVRNFACGSTPICNECARLADSGVVVVAAAGNHGYKSFQTTEGPYEGYAAFSITDPGNADAVITVGSTHRAWPHTYGVSFFSSRGPTGDGRLKPDLVAPGERIRAPLPGKSWGDLDGTSMAAPHVSGAAAMLMARYPEFIGKSRRLKQILCASATDLGRERTFQGQGMLDVLRAFQSI